jgi:hypothetical protein
MILLRLAGGLGNQLFQLAASLLLARRQDCHVLALTDALSAYALVRQPDSLRLIEADRLMHTTSQACPDWLRWASVHARAGRWAPWVKFNDAAFPARLGQAGRWMFVDGYFQQGWTETLLSEALSLVRLKCPPATQVSLDRFDCLLHIRGGDFLRLDSYSFLGVAYYSRCVDQARIEGCRQFGVISDDHHYARGMLLELALRHPDSVFDMLPPSADALGDFERLLLARRRIIGNSTFAWWACALGSPAATTWSPDRFTRHLPRDLFLPCERVISAEPAAA